MKEKRCKRCRGSGKVTSITGRTDPPWKSCPACQAPADESCTRTVQGEIEELMEYLRKLMVERYKDDKIVAIINFIEAQTKQLIEWEERYEDITGGMMKKEIELIQQNAKLLAKIAQLEAENKRLRLALGDVDLHAGNNLVQGIARKALQKEKEE